MNQDVQDTYHDLVTTLYDDGHKAHLRIIADDLIVDDNEATRSVLNHEQRATKHTQGIATVQPVFPVYIGRTHDHTALTLNPSRLNTTYASIHLGADSDGENESGLEAQLTSAPNTTSGITSHVSRTTPPHMVHDDQTTQLLTKDDVAAYLKLPHRSEQERGTASLIFNDHNTVTPNNTAYRPPVHVTNQAAYTLRKALSEAHLHVNDHTVNAEHVKDTNIDYSPR